MGELITLSTGETAIDLGTGSGLLAIVAAKLGAIAYATEPNPHAAQVAQTNFARNHATIYFQPGEYFAGFQQKFDVIIANLPQEILPPAMRSTWNRDLVEAVDGGKRGNEHVLKLLHIAPTYMHEDSRLIIVVYTGVFYEEILKRVKDKYQVKILAKKSGRVREFIEQERQFFEVLRQQKQILLHEKEGHLYADGIFLELKKKKGSPSS